MVTVQGHPAVAYSNALEMLDLPPSRQNCLHALTQSLDIVGLGLQFVLFTSHGDVIGIHFRRSGARSEHLPMFTTTIIH
jgi:hypothetical protein